MRFRPMLSELEQRCNPSGTNDGVIDPVPIDPGQPVQPGAPPIPPTVPPVLPGGPVPPTTPPVNPG